MNTSTSLRITVDPGSPVGPLDPFWAGQIIHPTERLLTEEGQSFLRLLAEKGACRAGVRIYNQPEEAIRPGADGQFSYDWSRFDGMADQIAALGCPLKVVFFAMPYELALDPTSEKTRPNGAKVCISPPKDYGLWRAMCADFMRHIMERFGEEAIRRWSFRCWNEPDLTHFWHEGNVTEYLKLYDYFADGVKSVCPEARIGGPALSANKIYLDPAPFIQFLDHITSGTNHATGTPGSPIDYLGIHTYGGKSGGPGHGRDYPDSDYMLEKQFRLRDIRNRYPTLRSVPIHVEEWGESSEGTTGIDRQPMSDIRNSEHGAAFLVNWVGRHLRLRQDGAADFTSFTFCASGYEIARTHDFHGYRTLHTLNGFHKPALNGYALLAKCADTQVRCQADPDTLQYQVVAAADMNRITVVVGDYQPSRIQNDGPASSVTIVVNNPWSEVVNLTLRHWRIDANHSNAYSVFKTLGSPETPSPEHVHAITDRMSLELLEPERRLPEAAEWTLDFDLPCNGVSLIEIDRTSKESP